MREFFKGWRRKTGVITLVVACVFAAGWVRSKYFFEIAFIPVSSTTTFVLVSAAGAIDVGRSWQPESKVELFFSTGELWSTNGDYLDGAGNLYPWDEDHQILWQWDWAGFRGGVSRLDDRLDLDCVIPYWSIVVPLTLLSAWLLLSKPRTKPEKPTVGSF